jgi:uncharacterized membrane protein
MTSAPISTSTSGAATDDFSRALPEQPAPGDSGRSTMSRAIDKLTTHPALDGPAELIRRVGGGVPRRLSQAGERLLGHPIHPAITDLPIGFWTSAWVLDFLPGRQAAGRASRSLIGLGLVSTLPAIVSGLGDAAELDRGRRRTASVHAAFNAGATAAFACSWWMRSNGTTRRAVVASNVGAALATVGGLLGGHLAFASADDGNNA